MTASPLAETELQRLSDILDGFGDGAMNLETLDGFLSALVCGPAVVSPGEFLSEIWGKGAAERGVFDVATEVNEFLGLVLRQWQGIRKTLQSGDFHVPVLFLEDGIARGNDWARGFLHGTTLHRGAWSRLLDDDDAAEIMIPIFALAHERDSDPAMRPFAEPITAEMRENLILGATAAVVQIDRLFENDRRDDALARAATELRRRRAHRVGRNEPCPCGSGRKFKNCCRRLEFR